MIFLFFFFSPFVLTSVASIRLSRIFLTLVLFTNYNTKLLSQTVNPYFRNFAKNILVLLTLYLSFLTLSTILNMVFASSFDYLPAAISTIGTRIEILMIVVIVSSLGSNKLKTAFFGFTCGFIVQFFQCVYTLLYNLRITSSPLFLSNLLVDQAKYDFLLPGVDQAGANRIAASSSDGFSLFRGSALVGEPSIFGIYSALCLTIFLFCYRDNLSALSNKYIRFTLVLMSLFACFMSGSKTSLLLLLVIPTSYFANSAIVTLKSSKISRLLIISLLLAASFFAFFVVVSSDNIFLQRFVQGSGHLDYLFTTINQMFDPEKLSDYFIGIGAGVASSKHRFFVTQMTEIGLIPGFLFCSLIFVVFYRFARCSRTNFTENRQLRFQSIIVSPIFILGAQFLLALLLYDPFTHPILWTSLMLGLNIFSSDCLREFSKHHHTFNISSSPH